MRCCLGRGSPDKLISANLAMKLYAALELSRNAAGCAMAEAVNRRPITAGA
jgi:hypothetical protein